MWEMIALAEVTVEGGPSKRENTVIFGTEDGLSPGIERGGWRVMNAKKGNVVVSSMRDAVHHKRLTRFNFDAVRGEDLL